MVFTRVFRNCAGKWLNGRATRPFNTNALDDLIQSNLVCWVAPTKKFVFLRLDELKNNLPVPLFYKNTVYSKSAEGAFIAGSNNCVRGCILTKVIIEKKDIAYYIGNGIILNEQGIPIIMVSFSDIFELGYTVHLDLSILANQDEPMNKFILKKLIPYILSKASNLEAYGFSLVNTKVFIVKPSWRKLVSEERNVEHMCELIDSMHSYNYEDS